MGEAVKGFTVDTFFVIFSTWRGGSFACYKAVDMEINNEGTRNGKHLIQATLLFQISALYSCLVHFENI